MTDYDRSRPVSSLVRHDPDELRSTLESWVVPGWTADIEDAFLREPGTAQLRALLNFTGRGLSLLELASLRIQRGL